jgi:micrococcal nuclease
MHTYKITHYRTIDGDTVELTLDLGFGISFNEKFRLYGINAPEKRPLDTRSAALASQSRLESFLQEALSSDSLVAQTKKGNPKEKYGRYLAVLKNSLTGEEINISLVAEGLAASYFGGAR